MAARMWVVGQMVHDDFRHGQPDMWLEQLPTVAGPHIDERFLASFGPRFDVIALRLAQGVEELSAVSTCTADELALHLTIEYAEDLVSDGALDWEWIDTLPRRTRDEDFGWLKDILFEDNDVLIPYDPAMDGAEDPESEIARIERFVNLPPERLVPDLWGSTDGAVGWVRVRTPPGPLLPSCLGTAARSERRARQQGTQDDLWVLPRGRDRVSGGHRRGLPEVAGARSCQGAQAGSVWALWRPGVVVRQR
ncbi:MAG: hypothetical protein ACK5O2_06315 [Microthrixaceae bacterium]